MVCPFCYTICSLDLLDGDAPISGHGLVRLQHFVLAFLIDAVGPAVPRLHAHKALGILLPQHSVVEAVVGIHSHLVAVATVGEGHGELHAGQQAHAVVSTFLAGEGDLFRGSGLLALGALGTGGALDIEVHILQLGSLEVGVEAEAEGHVGVALVDHGHVDDGSVALEVIVHQHGEIEGIEELGQRGGLQNQGHAVRADAFHIPCAQVGKAVVLHGVCLAVKDVHAVIRQAAVGEQHRHAEAGTVALGKIGVAGPDVLLAVQGEAGDHAAALRGDDQLGLCLSVGDDILLVAGTVFGDITGGDLIHSSVCPLLP